MQLVQRQKSEKALGHVGNFLDIFTKHINGYVYLTGHGSTLTLRFVTLHESNTPYFVYIFSVLCGSAYLGWII
jgi:hypothetical protein